MTRLADLPQLTTVLLPEGAPMRPFETEDGRRGMVRDLSYLEFVVEALIAQSAVRLAVCPASSFYDDFSFLPHALRSRIVKVDTNSEAYEKAFAVLLPVITELGIKIFDAELLMQAETAAEVFSEQNWRLAELFATP